MSRYFYVFLCILLTSYGQLVIKWQLNKLPALPHSFIYRSFVLTKIILTNVYVLSGFVAAYLAGLCWMTAIKKLNLNIAYPFMSLSFVIVFLASTVIFRESISYMQVIGLALIVLGVCFIGLSSNGAIST